MTSRAIDQLLDAAAVGAGKRVLDVATGPGYVAARAAERGAAVVGVDAAEAMVAIARGREPELEFRVADAEALPFADGSFDAVVANFLVLHLGRPERAVAELARVLAGGGRMALTVWDFADRAPFPGIFREAVAAAGATPPADVPEGPDFFRFSDGDEFARLLRGAGLQSVEVQTVEFSHRVASAEELWEGMLAGTVRTSALIDGQSGETRGRIRAELERLADAYRTGDGLELPVSVKLASGRR